VIASFRDLLSPLLFGLRSYPQVVLDKYHWMLYYLVPAMYPRFMITLDEDLKNLPVTVRVGQVRHNHDIPRLSYGF
jgi:hypothetical protein